MFGFLRKSAGKKETIELPQLASEIVALSKTINGYLQETDPNLKPSSDATRTVLAETLLFLTYLCDRTFFLRFGPAKRSEIMGQLRTAIVFFLKDDEFTKGKYLDLYNIRMSEYGPLALLPERDLASGGELKGTAIWKWCCVAGDIYGDGKNNGLVTGFAGPAMMKVMVQLKLNERDIQLLPSNG